MSAHPEMVELLAAACGDDGEAAAHARDCFECASAVREFAGLAPGVALDHELDDELAGIDPRDFVRDATAAMPRAVDEARAHVDRLSALAVSDADGACRELSLLRHERSFDHVLALLCQKITSVVPQNAAGVLTIARAVEVEIAHTTGMLPKDSLQAEALIVASYAQLVLGEVVEARECARTAARLVAHLPGSEFLLAVAEYFEANAAGFQRDYDAALALVRRSRRTFARFGQESWLGRAVGAEALLLSQQGNREQSLPLFDDALRRIDAERDAHSAVATLSNKAATLSQLGRMDEARSAYARALSVALKLRLDYSLQVIRNGLAEIDFKRGDLPRALAAFRRLAARAHDAGYLEDYAFAVLYVAECLGRLGRDTEMKATLHALKQERGITPFGASPAFAELFTCLDRGELDAGLVAYVREYLEGRASGEKTEYRPLRLRA